MTALCPVLRPSSACCWAEPDPLVDDPESTDHLLDYRYTLRHQIHAVIVQPLSHDRVMTDK